jgi:phospholipase C
MKLNRIVRIWIASGLTIVGGAIACTMMVSKWGLDAIDTMQTPPDPPMICGAQIPSANHSAQRGACTYAAGSHPSESLGIPASVSNTLPIRHVIILMQENRSFDHLLGKLHDQGQPGTEAVPADFTNPDASGAAVSMFHADTTCIPDDPKHQSQSMQAGVNGGKMDGFVKNAAASSEDPNGNPTTTDGHYVMSQYESTDLPFFYWLASTFALSDRHFAPLQSGTYASRDFMMFGTNAGVVDTGISYPDPNTNSIFRSLMNAGFTWGVYADGDPFSDTLNWTDQEPGMHTIDDLLKDLDQGTLPNVVFVDGKDAVEDCHPTGDLQICEAWARKIIQHAMTSPQWQRLAVIWTMDEGGGFADHVPPPSACQADPNSPFTALGVRVPLVAVSPWAKSHSVSHVVHDHTAITRFIETLFDLPALSARDANSDALMDLFDFSCGRDLTAPASIPAAGTGGCAPGSASSAPRYRSQPAGS